MHVTWKALIRVDPQSVYGSWGLGLFLAQMVNGMSYSHCSRQERGRVDRVATHAWIPPRESRTKQWNLLFESWIKLCLPPQ